MFPQELEAVEDAELLRFGAGFHCTHTQKVFDSFRRNPQEFEIVRTG